MNSIENNFVPYQIALDMKELGFDEPCIKGFYNKEPIYTVVTTPVDFNNKKQLGELLSAPLYSQCFDWFREKYNLFSYIIREIGINKGEVKYVGVYHKISARGNSPKNTCAVKETYKEAELECIKQLIITVKNDNK